ncbi:MAG: prolyl-tRNA synthetase associated domain-containing protein [Alphaproteobacteria bacterium]|nr:MAG: prolyl-tRNA synthetase associated domain-containing protein [Alphaproteobacteria bacterium]
MSAALKIIPTPDPLAAKFAELGIEVMTYEHRPVFTVAEGEDFKKLIPGGHTKNLFLKDKKDKIWLVTALDETVIDLKKLPPRINAARLSFGNAELMQRVIGVTPGSVTPLALLNDLSREVSPVLDHRLMEHEVINCHPLRNDRTTCLKPQDLVKFMKNLGYNPMIVDFSRL